MRERCGHCPLSGVCPGQQNTRVCEIADPQSPAHNPAILAELRKLADAPPVRPPIAASADLFRRMRACPHWQKSTDCGCGVNRCALGKGDRGMVGHHDCFECLKDQDDPPASPDPPTPPEKTGQAGL